MGFFGNIKGFTIIHQAVTASVTGAVYYNTRGYISF